MGKFWVLLSVLSSPQSPRPDPSEGERRNGFICYASRFSSLYRPGGAVQQSTYRFYIQVCAENAESTNKCSCSSTTPMLKPPEKALIAVVFHKIFLLHVRDCSGPVGTGVSLSNASCTRLDLLRDQACVNGNNPFLMSSNSSPNWA